MITTEDAAFAATATSPHLGRTPENYLIALAVPVARTAQRRDTAQLYTANEVGLSGNGVVPVYRMPEQVFSPTFLASLEGKPLCQEHPSMFLNADNYQSYVRGHVTNPRRGAQLDNGEWPVLCDLVIYDNTLAGLIEAGLMRECSCGYACKYLSCRDGAQQTELFANHIALVMRGRAGSEIRVSDAAEETIMDKQVREELSRAIALCEQVLAQKLGSQRSRMVPMTEGSSDAYAAYDAASKAGAEFSEAAKQAGRELGKKFLPQSCVTDAAPVRQHVDAAEDFVTASRRVGAAMRGQ